MASYYIEYRPTKNQIFIIIPQAYANLLYILLRALGMNLQKESFYHE